MVLYDGTHGKGSRVRVVQDTRYAWYTTKLGAYQKKNTTKFEKNTTQSIELVVFFPKLVLLFFLGTGV